MAFESLKAEINLLFEQMINEPEDMNELRMRLRDMLNEMRATGMPLPEDLVALERKLEADEAIGPDDLQGNAG